MKNLIRTTTEFAMHIVSAYVQPGDTVIDATCGNGHDTLRLAAMDPGALFAFDIQEAAIAATRQALAEHGYPLPSNPDGTLSSNPDASIKEASTNHGAAPQLICVNQLDHAQMPGYFQELGYPVAPETLYGSTNTDDSANTADAAGFASAVIFNLGYLPGADKSLTTRTDSTLAAVRGSLRLLKKDGLLCLTMYSGHPEGAKEKRALLAFAEGLDSSLWHASYISMPNQKNAPPEILLITRKR